MSLARPDKKKPVSLPGRLLAAFRGLSLWKKAAIIVIILLLIWTAGTKVFGQKSSASQYQTATAQRQSIIATVSESGNVSASSQFDVTSPSTGIIQEVYVKNGESVSEGQNLFKVKAVATPQEKASAYADYESALVSYNNAVQGQQAAQATLEKDRQAVLDAQNAVNYQTNNSTNPSTKQAYTQLEIDSLNSALTSAHETFTADETKYNNETTAIAAANASLQSSTLSYQATQDSVVTAPTDGTVANLSVDQGSSVTASNNSSSSNSTNSTSNTTNSTSGSNNSSSGSSTTNGSTVLVLGNFSELSVVTQVNEVDIPKIKVGQNATVTLDAFPNQTFVGQVESVDSVGTTSSNVVTFNVYINLISPPSNIKPGMTASVAIQTARRDNVISIPTAAIQTSDGTSYVRVLKNNQVSTVQVTTGISDDTNTEIISGINEGDVVITGTNATTTSGSTTSPFSGGFGGGARGGAGGGARGGGGGGGAVFFRGG